MHGAGRAAASHLPADVGGQGLIADPGPDADADGELVVVAVGVERTRDLRRRVLYDHLADPDPVYPQDGHPGSFHLGVVTGGGDGDVVAIASYTPEDTPLRPGRRSFRLRGMAVDPARRRRGVGTRLFTAGVEELRHRGAEALWANARDSALGFYEGVGMKVVGDGFPAAGGLPHHVVVLDLH